MRWRWALLGTVFAAIVAIVLLVQSGASSDPKKQVRLELAKHPVTVRVTRRPLVATVDVDGKLVAPPAPRLKIAADAEGKIVTSVAISRSTVVHEGDRIATVEGRPVVALQGVLPAYRDLSVGDGGPDVAQLMDALQRLGLRCTCRAHLTAVERDAVRSQLLRAPQRAFGRLVVLPAASVVWVRHLPVRLGTVGARVGQPAKNPIATGRAVATRVVAQSGDARQVRRGMKSVVRDPGGRRMRGRVMRVDRQAGRFWVTIPPIARSASDLPVVVTVQTIRRHGSALAVPVAALRRDQGATGSVGIVGSDGAVAIRAVTVGPELNGWVAIRRGVREGQRVVIASWDDDGRP
ncbi:MAG: hypothetical protein QOJ29_1878 [Thermoleophilaceae bacterium]|nr:hypothetical protein [Thermoleophilaceae bacterium]